MRIMHDCDTYYPPDLLQAWVVRALQLAEDLRGRRSIVHRRAGHDNGQQQAQGIHQDMAFSARDLLAAVITVFATQFGGLDGLTIDAGGTGRVLFSRGLPHSGPHGIQGLRIKIGRLDKVEKPALESDFDQYPEKPGDFFEYRNSV